MNKAADKKYQSARSKITFCSNYPFRSATAPQHNPSRWAIKLLVVCIGKTLLDTVSLRADIRHSTAIQHFSPYITTAHPVLILAVGL